MQRAARILMYSQDSLGLGHLRRATNLANALIAQRPDLSILLVVDSPLAPFFNLRERIDFVKLPTVIKVDAGVFRPGRLLVSHAMVKTLRARVLREVLRSFRPDLILVDHMPGGANRDLVPALEFSRLRDSPAKVVLGLRDIIDNPAITRAFWQREGFYDMLKRYYDGVLIYGSADIFPTAEIYGIYEAMQDAVQYCGYICNMDPIKPASRVRAKMRVDGVPLVAVLAGGGADGFRLMQTYFDALRLIDRSRSAATVMVTGPFMPSAQRRTLQGQAKQLGVQIHTAVGDTLSYINAADLIVSMAGYNTIGEILRFRKPAIIVPRPGPSAEQRMRAQLFAERGLIAVLDPQDLSAAVLARAVAQALTSPRPPNVDAVPALLGINTVTQTLLQTLGARSASRPVMA